MFTFDEFRFGQELALKLTVVVRWQHSLSNFKTLASLGVGYRLRLGVVTNISYKETHPGQSKSHHW